MNENKAKARTQLLIRLAYKGHSFYGVQRQPGLPTVAEALWERIVGATGETPRALTFAARTDRGVHALENYATCWVPKTPEMMRIKAEIEAHREDGLLGVSALEVPFYVHARGNASGKLYRYAIISEQSFSTIENQWPYSWAIAPRLDLLAMNKAAHVLLGRHDFTSFRGGGCAAGSTFKNISAIRIYKVFTGSPGTLVHIDIQGDGFLRRMIRNMAGTLLEVGSGLRSPEEVLDILQAKSRTTAGIMAPAHGLTLMKVNFAWETRQNEQTETDFYRS